MGAFTEKGYDCAWEVDFYGELLTTPGDKERIARYFSNYNPGAWPHPEPPSKDHPEIEELHKIKTKQFVDMVCSGEVPLREGVEELLSEADAAGWTIAVCSSDHMESVTAIVETLLPRFAANIRIFGGDGVSKIPEIYNLAAQELGLAPMKCVVLEDTKD